MGSFLFSLISYSAGLMLMKPLVLWKKKKKKKKKPTAFISSSMKDALYEFRIPGQQIYFLLNYLKFHPIFFLPRVFLMRSWPLLALLCFLYFMTAFKIFKNLLPSSPLPWYGCWNNTSRGFLHICTAWDFLSFLHLTLNYFTKFGEISTILHIICPSSFWDSNYL